MVWLIRSTVVAWLTVVTGLIVVGESIDITGSIAVAGSIVASISMIVSEGLFAVAKSIISARDGSFVETIRQLKYIVIRQLS